MDKQIQYYLLQVGVNKIFTEGAPGVVKDADVVVSKAFQEAFVKVDEEGATAGAFTGKLPLLYTTTIHGIGSNRNFYLDKVVLIT